MTKKIPPKDYEELEVVPFDQDDVAAESEEDLTSINAKSLGRAVVWGTDWTAATIVDQLKRGRITLDPEFQRRDAWKDDRKSRFIESLIMGLPIPQLVLAEHAKIKGRFIVIDGKQRLLSLSKFTGVGLAKDQKPLTLSGLKIRKDLNKRTYDDLKNDSLYEDLLSEFDNQSIRTVIIRGWQKEEVLYTIFHRLNTGSVPLSTQELRQALHPGPFLSWIARFSEESDGLRKLLGLSRPDFRMRDVELVLRFYAFRLRLPEYRGNLKGFLDDTCDKLNRSWPENRETLSGVAGDFEDAIQAAMKIFSRNNVFRKWDGTRFEKAPNRAVFDVVAYSLADPKVRAAALKKKDAVLTAFKKLCQNRQFRAAIESTTKSKEAVRTRFSKWSKALASVTGRPVRVALPK